MNKIWTIAYRKPTGPWFQRVDLELTWAQAYHLAGDLMKIRPDLQVYYVTTRAHDDRRVADWAAVGFASGPERDRAEDAHNILNDKGKRVAVKGTGKLDPRLAILSADEAKARFDKETN